jgi:chaperone BCS1
MNAINQVPANSLLLFEDIDCMRTGEPRFGAGGEAGERGPGASGAKTNASCQNGVTLSGLLNVLDGLFAPTGVLFVMTTNDIGKLDGALLRPGRIDYRLYLGRASIQQKVDLYRRFFPHACETQAREFVAASPGAETMAEFQGLLLALEEAEGANSQPELSLRGEQ